MLGALRGTHTAMPQQVRALSEDAEALYSAIKLYLAQMPREDLSDQDNRRWAEIIELAINLKLACDLIERMLRKVQQQKTSQRREFSQVGLEELTGLQEQLLANLRLGLSVFLSADPESARLLLRESAVFAPRNGAWRMPTSAVCNVRWCKVSRRVRYTWSSSPT